MNIWVKRSLIVLLSTALVLPLGVVFGHAAIYRNKIYPGVKIAQIDVGGLTRGEAAQRIARRIMPPDKFLLTRGDETWKIDFADLEAKLRAKDSAESAFDFGRKRGLVGNLRDRYDLLSKPVTTPISWSIKTERARPIVEQAARTIDQPPVDAKLLIDRTNIKIQPHQVERRTQVKKTLARIETALLNNRDRTGVVVLSREPTTTTGDIKKLRIETQLAEFSTNLNPTLNNRRHNIKLAVGKINNAHVKPGAVFSFNEIVGTRTSANGFRDAPVISGGNLVPGIGGGICQVATTIYNAAMMSGLPTVERSLHSNFISSYPAGRDATVVDGVIDLKFRNDTGGTLLLKGEVVQRAVIFKIYGPKTGRVTVFGDAIVSDYAGFATKVETDTALPAGAKVSDQTGVTGRTVKVSRKVTDRDGKVLIDTVTTSRYLSRQEKIRVGPAPSMETTSTTSSVSQ